MAKDKIRKENSMDHSPVPKFEQLAWPNKIHKSYYLSNFLSNFIKMVIVKTAKSPAFLL